jgi:hypothetical protein
LRILGIWSAARIVDVPLFDFRIVRPLPPSHVIARNHPTFVYLPGDGNLNPRQLTSGTISQAGRGLTPTIERDTPHDGLAGGGAGFGWRASHQISTRFEIGPRINSAW